MLPPRCKDMGAEAQVRHGYQSRAAHHRERQDRGRVFTECLTKNIKSMENKFNDSTLAEFAETIAKFAKKYETEKKNVTFFLVISEDQEDGIQISSTIKGKPLKITRVISNVIKNNKELQMASLINGFMNFGALKSEKKDDIIGALGFLKELAK